MSLHLFVALICVFSRQISVVAQSEEFFETYNEETSTVLSITIPAVIHSNETGIVTNTPSLTATEEFEPAYSVTTEESDEEPHARYSIFLFEFIFDVIFKKK